MRRQWQLAAFVIAALGTAFPAAAQTAGGGGGGTGTASTSPGVGAHNESETGVAIPGDAPVDNRTHQPVQVGTGEPAQSSEGRIARPSPFYVDLTRPSRTSTGSGGTGTSDTGPSDDRN